MSQCENPPRIYCVSTSTPEPQTDSSRFDNDCKIGMIEKLQHIFNVYELLVNPNLYFEGLLFVCLSDF